jgi:hypothetical protein
MKIKILLCVLVTVVYSLTLFSQSTRADSLSRQQIEKITENQYRLGNVFIDTEKRELTLNGVVNQDSGMIELVACAPGGKTHESVFVWDVVPYHLQVALLLLGLKNGKSVSVQGDTTLPIGDSVYVYVSWKEQGRTIEHRAEDVVFDILKNKPMEHTAWIFAGSKLIEGKFMADVEKSLMTTYRDPFTILDNPLRGGTDDTIYRVNTNVVPKKGSFISVRIVSQK